MTRDGDGEAFEEIVRHLREPSAPEALSDELRTLTKPGAPFHDRWYVIRVELLSGQDLVFKRPPGRDFLISAQHTFRQLAEAINQAFARWDLGHLYVFRLADGREIGTPFEELPYRDAARTKVARREKGEVFGYEFDLGDSWEHRCTVLDTEVDPEDIYGVRPKGPVAVWGWGSMPDQYGRTTPNG